MSIFQINGRDFLQIHCRQLLRWWEEGLTPKIPFFKILKVIFAHKITSRHDNSPNKTINLDKSAF